METAAALLAKSRLIPTAQVTELSVMSVGTALDVLLKFAMILTEMTGSAVLQTVRLSFLNGSALEELRTLPIYVLLNTEMESSLETKNAMTGTQ